MQKELDNSLCYALSVVCNWICTFVFCESALLTFIWILITIAVFCRDGFLEAGDVRTDFQCKLFICFSIRVCIKLCCSCCTSLSTWSHLPSQSCKIPNHCKLTLPTATRRCFTVKFSNSGLHLACSMTADEKYIIIVYSVCVCVPKLCKLCLCNVKFVL